MGGQRKTRLNSMKKSKSNADLKNEKERKQEHYSLPISM
jgi:hypothetical protein